jgi:hypothetical protein
LFSCGSEKPAIPAADPASPAEAAPVEAPPAEAAPKPAGERVAVLVRGNGWVSGISGFGDNAFPALSGEYRLEGAEFPETAGSAKAGRAVFSVRTSRAPLFFSGEWQSRPGAGAVFQRFQGEDLLAATVLEDNQGPWIVVFEFPGGIAESGLGDTGFNRLVGAWSSRFLYFLSFIKTQGDVSLPAVVAF